MKKLAIFSMLALLILGVISVGVFANPFEGRGEQRGMQNEGIQNALASGDYESWNELVEEMENERVRMSDLITEENFDKFVEMHQARQSGDFEKAQEIAEELGINKRGPKGMGPGRENHKGGSREGCQMQ